MGGMTSEEISSLFPMMLFNYQAYVTLQANEPNNQLQDMEHKGNIRRASKVLHMNLAQYAEPRPCTEATKSFLKEIFKVYSVVQSVLFIGALLGIIFGLCALRKRIFSTKEYLMLAIALGSLLLSLVYAFAIAWFCKFLNVSNVIFYGVGLIPMLMLFEIFGTYLLYRMLKGCLNWQR